MCNVSHSKILLFEILILIPLRLGFVFSKKVFLKMQKYFDKIPMHWEKLSKSFNMENEKLNYLFIGQYIFW